MKGSVDPVFQSEGAKDVAAVVGCPWQQGLKGVVVEQGQVHGRVELFARKQELLGAGRQRPACARDPRVGARELGHGAAVGAAVDDMLPLADVEAVLDPIQSQLVLGEGLPRKKRGRLAREYAEQGTVEEVVVPQEGEEGLALSDVVEVHAGEVGHADHVAFALEHGLLHHAHVVVHNVVEEAVEGEVLILQRVGELVGQEHLVGEVDPGHEANHVELYLRPPGIVFDQDHRAFGAIFRLAVAVVDAASKATNEALPRRGRIPACRQDAHFMIEVILLFEC